MNLTPLDIRKREFDRSLRGYDPQEVDAFLDMVAEQWEDLDDERRRLKNKVEELQSRMDHYQEVEEALQQALDQTRKNAEETLQNAREKAERIVEDAKAEAAEIEREAERIVEDARDQAQEIKRDAEAEREQLKADIRHLQNRRTEAVARLRGFLNSELEVLEAYDREDAPSDPPSTGAAEPPADEAASPEPTNS